MFRQIKKGESVVGMRAIHVKGKAYYRGPPVVRGFYLGKIRNLHMVSTRRKIYLCTDVQQEE